jgi:ABC-type nickel/cobalt efflux system permease component RcnA
MQINKRWFALAVIVISAGTLIACIPFQQLYMSLVMMTQSGQRLFHDEIADKLQLIKTTHSYAATSSLALVGFLYGALHSVGPGHGKVVVSSYLLASKSGLKRGLIVTFLSSLLQACVAIALVYGLMSLFGLTRDETAQTAVMLENFSFGLIILIGLALIGRGARELGRLLRSPHEECCSCACGHAPEPQKLNKVHDLASLAGMVFSIGLRPCSGAILLLLFAGLVGVYGAGVLATFAMALGTALTTGSLAILTVQSKSLALRLTQTSGDKLRFLHAGLGIAGGLMIILLGTAFLSSNSASAQSDGMSVAKDHPLMKSLYQGK